MNYSLKGWNVEKLTRRHKSGPLTPCSVDNDCARYVTAELAYGTAHVHHEALTRCRLVWAVHLHELHHESPSCCYCCVRAILEWHHGYVMWGYAMNMSQLRSGYVTAAAMAAASARREAVLWLPCQPGENVSAVPMASWISFQSLSLCLAYPGFSDHCKTATKCIYHKHPQTFDFEVSELQMKDR